MSQYPFDPGYCSVSDIELLFPNKELYSNLDSDRIEAAIADATTEIDGIVSRFYLTPVTDPTGVALSYLRVVAKYWATSLIHQHYFVATNPSGKSSGQQWMTKAKELLDRVVPPRDDKNPTVKGAQPYPIVRFFNAPLQVNTELPDFPDGAAAGFNSDNDQDLNPDEEPFFQRSDRMRIKGGLM